MKKVAKNYPGKCPKVEHKAMRDVALERIETITKEFTLLLSKVEEEDVAKWGIQPNKDLILDIQNKLISLKEERIQTEFIIEEFSYLDNSHVLKDFYFESLVHLDQMSEFKFKIHRNFEFNLEVYVKSPTSNLPFVVERIESTSSEFLGRFKPEEIGLHLIFIDCNQMPVAGSPFRFQVYEDDSFLNDELCSTGDELMQVKFKRNFMKIVLLF